MATPIKISQLPGGTPTTADVGVFNQGGVTKQFSFDDVPVSTPIQAAINAGTGPISSVSNSDGTLTISPTTGAVVASRAAITGDVTINAGSNTSTLATVNSNVGSFTSANITVDAKGRITAAASGSGSAQTLAQTLIAGNTTGSTDIVVSSGQVIKGQSSLALEDSTGDNFYYASSSYLFQQWYNGTNSTDFLLQGSGTQLYSDTSIDIQSKTGLYGFFGGVARSGIFDMSGISSTDKTFTFPNTSGTIALTSDLSAYANTALSNLSSVSINTTLVSDTDNTDDLGTSGVGWRTGYFATSLLVPKIQFGGTTSSFPMFKRTTTAVNLRLADDSGDAGFTAGASTFSGQMALGANNITMTGSLAATGNRILKGWFTDIESTNMPTVGGTSLSSTFQPLDSDLTTIAGLTATTGNFIQSFGSAWASRTPTEATATLINMVGDSGSGGTKGLVPAPAAGDAAAGKFLKADGTWATTGGGAGATTALDNLSAVAINAALVLGTSDAFALGSTTKQWSDLFLAEGGVINWDNGDATLTQVGDVLTLGGADLKVTTPGNVSTSVLTTDGTQTLTNKTLTSATVTTKISPTSDDGAPLGDTTHNFSDLFLASGGVVNFANGNATVTHSSGLLTSNVDIVVPDEAYGSGWNGSVEVPTKNAVYDKIETISSPTCLTLIPRPQVPFDVTSTNNTLTLNDNTILNLGQVIIPFKITANKISIKTGNTVTTPGTAQLTLYAEDGQTQIFSVTTASMSATATIYTTSLSAVVINPGVYYMAINSIGTTDLIVYAYVESTLNAFSLTAGLPWDVTSEPVIGGTIAISASTTPGTITPTSVVEAIRKIVVFRLDN